MKYLFYTPTREPFWWGSAPPEMLKITALRFIPSIVGKEKVPLATSRRVAFAFKYEIIVNASLLSFSVDNHSICNDKLSYRKDSEDK